MARSVIALAKSRGFRIISLVRRAELIDEVIAGWSDASLLNQVRSRAQIGAIVSTDGVRLALVGVGRQSKNGWPPLSSRKEPWKCKPY